LTPEDGLKVYEGMLESMKKCGYDWPVRKLRKTNSGFEVTIPVHVRGFFEFKPGDWMVFSDTIWPCVYGIMKMPRSWIATNRKGTVKHPDLYFRKVRTRKNSMSVTLPGQICKAIPAEVGDTVLFAYNHMRNAFGMCVVKAGTLPDYTPAEIEDIKEARRTASVRAEMREKQDAENRKKQAGISAARTLAGTR